MTEVRLWYGDDDLTVNVPGGISLEIASVKSIPPARDPLGLVARALDDPVAGPPLVDVASVSRNVAIVVPDRTRPAFTHQTLLPVISRLARAGVSPSKMRVVIARGIHAAAPRHEVERLLGSDVMMLRPVQSAPNSPELNEQILDHPRLGPVRVHRQVATADLVILTGSVAPHHLAGWSGGAKALVPGVAERDTIIAAHRLTLDTLVRPDGSIRPSTARLEPNPFRDALLQVARAWGRAYLLNVVLGDANSIVGAAAGEVGHAHEEAVGIWRSLRQPADPTPADLVLVGTRAPRDGDLIQAHKALLAAVAWAKPGAPIVWLARAPRGAGHADFLPWFEAGKLPRHLASLRERFHPYGLTAYSLRRIAKDHPVHVVSEASPDILRPMGLLAFTHAQKAVDHALANADVSTCAVLPEA